MNQEKANGLFQIKFNLKSLIVIVLLGIGLYFLFPKIIGIPQALKLLVQVNKGYLGLAIGAEIASYIGAATLLGVILIRLGYKVRFWDRFRIGSIASFAIHFFPVGSFGEGAVDYYFLRKRNVETGSILLMFVLRLIFTYASFLLIFLVGLALVPTAPMLKFSPKLISLILFALVFGGVLYMFYLYQHKERFYKLWRRFARFTDAFLSKIRGKEITPVEEDEVFEDIYKGMGLFSKKKRASVFAFLAAALYWLGDITCFYFVFLGFGYHISWGILIFGYGIASLVGMISFIPGGLGVTEGSLGLLYSGLGVPSGIALISILVFRLFSFWIWIPFGLYSFISLTRESK